MESFSSYQNPGNANAMTEAEFSRLSQTVGTNIQKILQNGDLMLI